MVSRLVIALAASVAFAGIAAAQPPQPTQAPRPVADWSAAARDDILAGYDRFVASHPGMHDPANRGFPVQLARARDLALEVAGRARTRAGYVEALGTFTAQLGDGHAVLYSPSAATGDTQPEWPGFIAGWRGEDVIVHSAGEASPAPAGSNILSCDGTAAALLVRRRLLTLGFRPREAGHWWARTPQAFISSPMYTAPRPERCRFRLPDGSEREAALTWLPAPDDLSRRMLMATDGERTPIGLTEPRRGLFLIGMPTFQPDDSGREQYRALYQAMAERRPELSRARAIVIDLRHNNGGSSSWASLLAQRLWGETAVRGLIRSFFARTSIWWRASEGNIAHMEELADLIRRNGNPAGAEQTLRFRDAMRAALAAGEPYFVQRLDTPDAPAQPPADPDPQQPLQAPVYVITPGRCASACLDALDIFTRFPNTRLIGAPTSADSAYMEVRTEALPSGHGRIVIPVKMWVGRPRAPGQIYRPHILMDSLDWSTATFLDRIERDLPTARR